MSPCKLYQKACLSSSPVMHASHSRKDSGQRAYAIGLYQEASERLMTDIWAATLIMPCLLCTCAQQASIAIARDAQSKCLQRCNCSLFGVLES